MSYTDLGLELVQIGGMDDGHLPFALRLGYGVMGGRYVVTRERVRSWEKETRGKEMIPT